MGKTWQERFDEFDAAHPEVYETFVRYAEQALNAGVRHYGASAIITVMRFHSDADGRDTDCFKLNQNYAGYYARKLMREDSRFARFFEIRKLANERAA